MSQPSWLPDTLAGIMIITAAYCVGRLVISRRQHRPTDHQVDAVHVLMGVAMAGMLVPRLRVLWAGGWEIVFAAAVAWFSWHALRGLRSRDSTGRRERHHLQHALACGAMLYMLLASAGEAAASGAASGLAAGRMAAGTAHFPTLALILAVALLGYVVWTADQLPSLAPVAAIAAARAPVAALASSGRAGGAGQGGSPQPAAGSAGHRRGAPVSPRLAACCEIAMGVTMGYMLIMMV